MKTIVIDVGGTFIKSGIFLNNNLVENRKDKTFVKEKSKKEFEKNFVNVVKHYRDFYGEIDKIKISFPGAFKDKKRGILKYSKNLFLEEGYNIFKLIKKHFKEVNLFIENDANCFALGEYFYEKENYKNIIGITLGTGLGIGIIINGKLYVGEGNAGELSQFKYNKFELENYVNTDFLLKLSKKLKYKIDTLEELVNKKKYEKLWKEYSKNLSIVISLIIYSLDPEAIIFGGGISNSFECFKDFLVENLKKNVKIKLPKLKKKRNLSNLYGTFLIPEE